MPTLNAKEGSNNSYFTVQEFSADRKISVRFTREEIWKGKLGVCRFGRRVLIPASEAERYDRECFVAPVDLRAMARNAIN